MNTLLLITSNYGEYYKDIVSVITLPENSEYRFRYGIRHLNIELLEKLKTCPDNVKGIIVYTRREELLESEKSSETIKQFIPIREVELKQIQRTEGSFIYFTFVVKKIPFINNDIVMEFSQIVSDYRAKKKESAMWIVEDTDGLIKLDSKKDVSICIENIVNFLKFEEKLDHSIYVTNVEIYYRDDRKPIEQGSNGIYHLESGRYYRLEFSHNYFSKETLEKYFISNNKQFPPIFVELLYPKLLISPILVKKRLQGRYDLNRFYFYLCRQLSSKPGIIILEQDPQNNDPNFIFPTVTLSIESISNWPYPRSLFLCLIGVSLGLIVGIIYYTFCQKTIPDATFFVAIVTLLVLLFGIFNKTSENS